MSCGTFLPQPDERIQAISYGKVARVRVLRRTWLIVVTDKRLVCVHSGRRSGWRQLEVAGAEITRVALRVGPLRGRVLVVAGGRKYRLLVPRADSYKLSSVLSGMGATSREALTRGGPAIMVRRVFDHVLALPAAALNPGSLNPGSLNALPAVPPDTSATDRRVELLEDQIHELQRQVDFLEQLLHERHAIPAPRNAPASRDAAAASRDAAEPKDTARPKRVKASSAAPNDDQPWTDNDSEDTQ